MSVNLRYPNITAGSPQEQISQIKSYLHQLVEQLNYALPSMGSTSQTYEVQGAEISYYDLRTLIMQELNDVQTTFDQLLKQLEEEYVKRTGWEADKRLATDAEGKVVAVDNSLTEGDINTVASQAVQKISFTLDEDGNLYYEILEE